MLRNLFITTCVGAASWIGMAETSEAQVRVYRGPNRTFVNVSPQRYYAPAVPVYGVPMYGPQMMAAPVYAPAPVVVHRAPSRSVVVTPNRIRVAGPNGAIRIRR